MKEQGLCPKCLNRLNWNPPVKFNQSSDHTDFCFTCLGWSIPPIPACELEIGDNLCPECKCKLFDSWHVLPPELYLRPLGDDNVCARCFGIAVPPIPATELGID